MLNYTLQTDPTADRCRVCLKGDATLDDSKAVLSRLWDDPEYARTRTAIWDLSGCETLPEFSELFALAKFIANEKAGRGPQTVVFTSPAFASSMFARALRGFEFLVGLNVNFLTNTAQAQTWLDELDQPVD